MLFASVVGAQDLVVKIWPAGAPGAVVAPGYVEAISYWNNDKGWPLIKAVSDPTLEVFQPEKSKASGAVVVICPGGGYYSINIDKEGRDVARWLAGQGVMGILLKYRLPSDVIMRDRALGPLQDVQEAIRTVRRNAKAWSVKADSIGVMGFSSGGHLAATASTLYDEKTYEPADTVSARPDFCILVYPLISMQPSITSHGLSRDLLGEGPDKALISRFSAELHVTAETPPTFMVHAKDDQAVPVEHSLRYHHALQDHGVAVELHLYEKGNHGFGLGLFPDSPKTWPDELKAWLKVKGLLR